MIKLAEIEQIDDIMRIINDAKQLLKESGSTQWQDTDGYPRREDLIQDINYRELYVCIKDTICGIIAITNPETTYDTIYDGNWLTNGDYVIIHRLAVAKEYYHQGVAKELINFSIDYAKKHHIPSIRSDTMDINLPMTNLLILHGFIRTGKIDLQRQGCIDPVRTTYELLVKGV